MSERTGPDIWISIVIALTLVNIADGYYSLHRELAECDKDTAQESE